MVPSEAAEIVARLLAQFPNGGGNVDQYGYVASLTMVLCEYPRHLAYKVAHPIHGVRCKFKPTPTDLTEYLDREVEGLQEIVDRDDRERKAREEREAGRKADAELAASRKAKSSYDELKAKHGPTWGLRTAPGDRLIDPANAESTAAVQRHAAQADRETKAMLAEYARLGLEPRYAGDMLISPWLVKSLKPKDA